MVEIVNELRTNCSWCTPCSACKSLMTNAEDEIAYLLRKVHLMSTIRCVATCIITRLEVMESLRRIEECTDSSEAWTEWCLHDAEVLERISSKIRTRLTLATRKRGCSFMGAEE